MPGIKKTHFFFNSFVNISIVSSSEEKFLMNRQSKLFRRVYIFVAKAMILYNPLILGVFLSLIWYMHRFLVVLFLLFSLVVVIIVNFPSFCARICISS